MKSRRDFLSTTSQGATLFSLGTMLPSFASKSVFSPDSMPSLAIGAIESFKMPHKFGLGGVALGNGFKKETTEVLATDTLAEAWNVGVRYFDTSPWYGLGLSEHRFGEFLRTKNRSEYMISSKVGRLLKGSNKVPETQWINPLPNTYVYDYTAAGVRRSVEDSLQRMGIESLDIVFIHDLSPDNKDMGAKWKEYFEVAKNGAMPELTKMRDEGLIKAWGLGVNTPEPILATLKVANPDIFLMAAQYSLIDHAYALNTVFPALRNQNVSLVMGSSMNAGFLAGRDRYNYEPGIPAGHLEKRAKLEKVAKNHNVDLKTAAIQFSAMPDVVSSLIVGARTPQQIKEDMASTLAFVPAGFWNQLKEEKLIELNAPVSRS